MLHSDVKNIFVRLLLNELRLKVANLGLCLHTCILFDRHVEVKAFLLEQHILLLLVFLPIVTVLKSRLRIALRRALELATLEATTFLSRARQQVYREVRIEGARVLLLESRLLKYLLSAIVNEVWLRKVASWVIVDNIIHALLVILLLAKATCCKLGCVRPTTPI